MVRYQLGIVRHTHGAIKNDRVAFDAAVSVASANLGAVQTDILAAQEAWATLQRAVAANTDSTSPPRYAQADVDRAVQAAQQQIDTANVGINGAQGRAADYDERAATLDQTASDFVAALTCVKTPTPTVTPPAPVR
jgi:hypothetical protein